MERIPNVRSREITDDLHTVTEEIYTKQLRWFGYVQRTGKKTQGTDVELDARSRHRDAGARHRTRPESRRCRITCVMMIVNV